VRRIGLGLVMAAAMLVTSACAAGKQAQTANERPTIDGSNAQIGDIALRDIAIQAPASGTYETGQDAVLIGIIVNDGAKPDQLTDVTTKAANGWGAFKSASDASAVATADQAGTPASASPGATLPIAGKSVSVKPGERASFGVPNSTGAILLTDLTGRLYPAQTVKITFRFAHAGSVTMYVPVQITGKNNSVPIPELSSSTGE
jgi:copper(I)-binding protein